MGFTDLMTALNCCASSPEPSSRDGACRQCPYRFLGAEACRRHVVRGAAQYIDQLQTLLVMALQHTVPAEDE